MLKRELQAYIFGQSCDSFVARSDLLQQVQIRHRVLDVWRQVVNLPKKI